MLDPLLVTINNLNQVLRLVITNPTCVLYQHPQRLSPAMGSHLCRLILTNTLTSNELITLQQSHYPYATTNYLIAFSHSKHHIAVLISPKSLCSHLAIDIEDTPISEKVATRFFHHNTLLFIRQQNQSQQAQLRQRIWSYLECLIKINDGQLFSGMRTNIEYNLLQYILNPSLYMYYTQHEHCIRFVDNTCIILKAAVEH